ncbi:MAG TPA: hypothetical protein VMH90_04695, partial [Thermoplasmata archaeon]|nr:hypothetical protein [Thermoplasmata archaeon]
MHEIYRTPPTRRGLWASVLVAALLTGLPVLPGVAPAHRADAPAEIRSVPGGLPVRSDAGDPAAAIPQTTGYPVGNHVFSVNATSAPGVAYPTEFSALDPTSHLVYTLESAGDLSIFGADNGTWVGGGV